MSSKFELTTEILSFATAALTFLSALIGFGYRIWKKRKKATLDISRANDPNDNPASSINLPPAEPTKDEDEDVSKAITKIAAETSTTLSDAVALEVQLAKRLASTFAQAWKETTDEPNIAESQLTQQHSKKKQSDQTPTPRPTQFQKKSREESTRLSQFAQKLALRATQALNNTANDDSNSDVADSVDR